MQQQLAKVIIDELKKQAAKEVIGLLAARSSFFASWFMSPILSFIVPLVIDILYDKIALGVNWLWIIVENNAELKNAIGSKEKLEKILSAGGDYTQAEREFNEATDDLIRHNFERLPR